uniref:Uncharacterized protein n=1 Tax=Gasterosteus aculeatus TaxID=69293 RepID=G3NQE1_GASAC
MKSHITLSQSKTQSSGQNVKKIDRTFSGSIDLEWQFIPKIHLTWKIIFFRHCANTSHWQRLHVWTNKTIPQTIAGFVLRSNYLHARALTSHLSSLCL